MTKPGHLRLGVNIDHVATIRNARGGDHPDPLRAAAIAAAAGADGITAHLREDRRHIGDRDIERLRHTIALPLNLEMAATDEMLAIALRHRPHAACIVPERREERTTEGGIDAAGQHNRLKHIVDALGEADVRVSLFIEADRRQLDAAIALGAPVVELHTGAYCEAWHSGPEAFERERQRIATAATYGKGLGLEVHAGHGLSYDTVKPIAEIPELAELNIGHFLIGEAIFVEPGGEHPHHAAPHGRGTGGRRDGRRGALRMIIGIGNDTIDIRRVEKVIERHGDRFTARIFTDIEQRKSDRRKLRAASYAKRFAAKEACSKALGTGIRGGVFWRDMGVVNLPSGKPTMVLTGGAAKRLAALTPSGHRAEIHVTITDDFPLAQALVIIEAVPGTGAS